MGFLSSQEETSGLSQKADLMAGRPLKTGQMKGLCMTSLMWKGLVKKEYYWEPLSLVFRQHIVLVSTNTDGGHETVPQSKKEK